MRKKSFLLCALVLAACLLGLLYLQDMPPDADAPPEEREAGAAIESIHVQVNKEAALEKLPAAAINVYDHAQKKTVEMDLEEYLIHVIAGEMPASFEMEALKAQAVAARSYILWKSVGFGGGGCSKQKGADVCTDSSHCMAYSSDAEMKKNWGGDYELYYGKIRMAVLETGGLVCVYEGEPIQALFHSISGGRTENSIAVFTQALPYLSSVESLGEEEASKYQSERRFTRAALAKALNAAFPKAALEKEKLEEQISIAERTQSGRVSKAMLGRQSVTGKEIRYALGLNSTNFSIEYEGENVCFLVKGYGHGVGMSQVGANAMAKEGTGFEQILLHYYRGVSIKNMSSLA